MHARDLFELDKSYHLHRFLLDFENIWQAVACLEEFLENNSQAITVPNKDFEQIGDRIIKHKTAHIHPQACIEGPRVIIGAGTDIGPFAYIRKNVIIGSNCKLRSEIKNSIILDHATAPHMAYIGDSIIGNFVNLGVHTVLSNIKFAAIYQERKDKQVTQTIKVFKKDGVIDTGLVKLGAILGDYTQIGCNVTLKPGTIIPKEHVVFNNHKGQLEIVPIETLLKHK